MAAGDFWINDFDADDLGLGLRHGDRGAHWRSGVSFVTRTPPVPGTLGAAIVAAESVSEPRPIVVQGVLEGTSMSDLRDKRDELKARASRGTVRLRFSDQSDREFFATLERFESTGIRPDLSQALDLVRMEFICNDPQAYATQPTVVDFASKKASLPLGSGVSSPILQIGAGTNPTVTLKDGQGTTVDTLTITATIGSTDYYIIDCLLMEVVNKAGTRKVSEMSGDFFAFSPQDGDATLGEPAPTISVSGSPGIARAIYNKAYL